MGVSPLSHALATGSGCGDMVYPLPMSASASPHPERPSVRTDFPNIVRRTVELLCRGDHGLKFKREGGGVRVASGAVGWNTCPSFLWEMEMTADRVALSTAMDMVRRHHAVHLVFKSEGLIKVC